MAKKRSFDTPEPGPRQISPEQAIVLLNGQIEKGTILLDWSGGSDDYESWKLITRNFLEKAFGTNSSNVSSVMDVGRYGSFPLNAGEDWWQNHRNKSLREQIKKLKGLIELLSTEAQLEVGVAPRASAHVAGHKIFLVHGHDEVFNKVARFWGDCLGRQEDVIVLSEQPNQGRTIIEKVEDCSPDIGFAVVLLTPDDWGGPIATCDQQQQRARQNVIFELGYFLGHLGRNRVCVLSREGVEMPSNYSGVLYVELDAADGWQLKLKKELEAAGLPVDMT